MAPSFDLESKFYAQGFPLVAGVDEAGRGPLAGPVVAGAVIFPGSLFSSPHSNGQPDRAWLDKVDDSKALSHRQRLEALEHIREHALALGVGLATAQEIDAYGIVPATKKAMQRALDSLDVAPSHLLIDHVQLKAPGIPFLFPAPRRQRQLFHRGGVYIGQGHPGSDDVGGGRHIPRIRLCIP